VHETASQSPRHYRAARIARRIAGDVQPNRQRDVDALMDGRNLTA
jgi:hypothetical protein